MKRLVLGIVILTSLSLIIFFSQSFISPYTTFEKAGTSLDKVQIIGIPERQTDNIFDAEGCLILNLSDYYDPESSMTVKYCRGVPKNLSHAEQVVAHGQYDKKEEIFIASRLYFKCPSKYKEKIEE